MIFIKTSSYFSYDRHKILKYCQMIFQVCQFCHQHIPDLNLHCKTMQFCWRKQIQRGVCLFKLWAWRIGHQYQNHLLGQINLATTMISSYRCFQSHVQGWMIRLQLIWTWFLHIRSTTPLCRQKSYCWTNVALQTMILAKPINQCWSQRTQK